MFRFEKLEVWRKAVEFADHVYRQTQRFPAAERYGLTNQMRRAAVSVSSNIAEGSGRGTDKEFARFVQMAYGLLMEVVSQAAIARTQSFLDEKPHGELYAKAEELAKMLSGLRSRLNRSS